MELFAAIRFDRQRHGTSIRGLAERYGVHRRTVRQAIESVIPPDRRTPSRGRPVLDAVRGYIDAMLIADLAAPRKQRHTARRVFDRLVDEHDARVSYSYVATYVHRRRAQITVERAGRAGVLAGFVPQQRAPGAEAEVDFTDVWVNLAGQMTKCFLFTLRLSHSGKAVHRVFGTQGQEAFMQATWLPSTSSAVSRRRRSATTICGGLPPDLGHGVYAAGVSVVDVVRVRSWVIGDCCASREWRRTVL
jgi:hypothetical protein